MTSSTGHSVLQWRKFDFFSLEDSVDNGTLESLVKRDQTVSSVCSGRSTIYIGDSAGYIHSLGRSLRPSSPSFPAHDAPVTWLWSAQSVSILVTLAHSESRGSEIKIWSPDKLTADQPILLRFFHPDPRPAASKSGQTASHSSVAPRVTAVAVHPNLNMMAIGFVNGAVMLYRGELSKERDKGSTMRVIVTLSTCITNLHFRTATHTYSGHQTNKRGRNNTAVPSVNILTTELIVTTLSNVYSIECTYRDKEKTNELDNIGCNKGCSSLSEDRGEQFIVIARDDAVYTYNKDGRAAQYAFPGPKSYLLSHKSYAVVISKQSDGNTLKDICTIYNLRNNLIAFTYPLHGQLVEFVCEWGGLYGIYKSDDSKNIPVMMLCREKDLKNKMEILFKKNQYDIAVGLAKGQNVGSEGIAEILKQYGDWLYSKGDFSMAVHQYIKTIPHLEPSYVIKKFLSSEHMPLLADYLEALHALNLHTPDHSSLLLNCYTRHKDASRIQKYIDNHSQQVMKSKKNGTAKSVVDLRNSVNSSTRGLGGTLFSSSDVEALVTVCRESSFFEEALKLSELHGLHSLHIDILCNDVSHYQEAIKYISSLEFDAACDQMLSHGSVLARGCPDQTLSLLIRLATGYTPDGEMLVGEQSLDGYVKSPESRQAPPENFESVLCNDSLLTIRYIEGVNDKLPNRLMQSGRLCEMLLSEYLHQLDTLKDDIVYRDIWEEKVKSIISDDKYPINPSMACLLCDRYNYPDGKLIVWRAKKMYENILQYHMDQHNEGELVRVCVESGSSDTWLCAFRLITGPTLSRAPDSSALTTILQKIDEDRLLPPMEVIDLLSVCPHITLGQVRSYLTRLADKEERFASEDRAAVNELCQKTEGVRQSINDLQNSGLVFTENNCDACGKDLSFPTVHFFCKHSFHSQCFEAYCSNNEEECPVCQPKHMAIKDALKNQEKDRARIHCFGEGLIESGPTEDTPKEVDVFAELAEYLSAGLFTDYSKVLASRSVQRTSNRANSLAEKGTLSSGNSSPATNSPAATSPTTSPKSQQPRVVPNALENSQNVASSESRLRMKEVRVQPSLQTASEGRTRLGDRNNDSLVAAGAEARVRTGETDRYQPGAGVSEGRLRQGTGTRPSPRLQESEGRVRSDVTSNMMIPESEARLRSSAQGRKFGGQGLGGSPNPAKRNASSFAPSSLQDHITAPKKSPSQRHKIVVPEPLESISSSLSNPKPLRRVEASNPFEEEETNPFGDDFETEEIGGDGSFDDDTTNPFGDEEAANPFSDDQTDKQGGDVYDETLNPFCD